MQQIDSGHYDVSKGENITLSIVANKVNEDVAVSLDGNTLPATSDHPLVYNFPVTKAVGAHFIDIECHFTAADAPDAYYQFLVSGSNGGGQCNAGSIREADNDWEAVIQFTLL
jgi:hypothetical protein